MSRPRVDTAEARASFRVASNLWLNHVRLRTYIHGPEVLAEVCAELGVPFKSSG